MVRHPCAGGQAEAAPKATLRRCAVVRPVKQAPASGASPRSGRSYAELVAVRVGQLGRSVLVGRDQGRTQRYQPVDLRMQIGAGRGEQETLRVAHDLRRDGWTGPGYLRAA